MRAAWFVAVHAQRFVREVVDLQSQIHALADAQRGAEVRIELRVARAAGERLEVSATDTLGGRIVFARTPDGAPPDGAAVDADGCVWSAQLGASRVVRYAPSGAIDG